MGSSGEVLVGILMGSKSDWDAMSRAAGVLDDFGVGNEARVISAHRAPDALTEYVKTAEERGLEVMITGAGLAAALPGVVAAHTTMPVLGVPLESGPLSGVDALHSIVQMPPGIPVGTLAIGKVGATNAGLLAVSILANKYPEYKEKLKAFREEQTRKVLAVELD